MKSAMGRPGQLLGIACLLIISWILPGRVEARDSLPNARFFIEEIQVQGGRTLSNHVLLAHGLLEPEREYDEIHLSDALNRIRKLPFVYDCDFSLKKGSSRGRYVLLIQVTEVRALTFGLHTPDNRDLLLSQREPDQFDGVLLANWRILKRGAFEFYTTLGGGLRYRDDFGGGFHSIGMLYYGLGGERSVSQLEWTSQTGTDLEDAIDLKSNEGREERTTFKHVQHLQGNHWLQLEIYQSKWKNSCSPFLFDFDSDFEPLRKSTSDGVGGSLGWTYNSADDAWLPSRGTVYHLGLDFQERETNYVRPHLWRDHPLEEQQSMFFFDWQHYLPLSTRRVLAFSFGGMSSESEYNLAPSRVHDDQRLNVQHRPFDEWYGYIGADYSFKLNRKWWILQDLRLHYGLALQAGNLANFDSDYPGLIPGFHEFQRGVLSLGISSRNRWGILRFHIKFADYSTRTLDEFEEAAR